MWRIIRFCRRGREEPDFEPGQLWVPRVGRSTMPRLIEAAVPRSFGRRAWRWRHQPPSRRTEVWSERRLRSWVRAQRAVCVPPSERF